MKNRYLTQVIVALIFAIISGILTTFYFVGNYPFAFGCSFGLTIFFTFKVGYAWNDYSAMTFLLKTMKEYIDDLDNIVNPPEHKE